MAITQISISPYLRQFLIDKYGSEPVSFPQNSMFQRHITEGCAPPPVIRNIIQGKFKPESISSNEEFTDKCIPITTEKSYYKSDRKTFITVCLPETVFRCGKVVAVNDTWSLNYDSCRSFRETADRMFWTDCEEWIIDYKRARRANNEYFSRENAIRDFMIYHQIDMYHDETIIRQSKRRKYALQNNKATDNQANSFNI